ncbi:23S rRNA (pseudouridine(1915)-N(3))-methyltransferase RlmH [Candidatus Protochlamydia sp. R18]|uniref:23S rRNA (pseudouridine(1915)-N(3))-methyltransferase RlmH n=1 Tax=Candidatus Protochlamydia sp. R18 TaxID=1353977 RepID=UPI0005A74942|nr:23S rRNA (pseudouridine(1915)-N(3))-methyltransferase RlmH [Candidatus Protochlamydia sp. R18]
MLKLRILSVGKTKEKWLEDAFNEYQKRLKANLQIECLWAKDSYQLLEWTQKESLIICLDPTGRLLTSEAFATFLSKCWEQGGSRLTIVIGGAEGLPLELKQHSILISLSLLTFTHQITRLILIEQIYRATEILKNSQYHK